VKTLAGRVVSTAVLTDDPVLAFQARERVPLLDTPPGFHRTVAVKKLSPGNRRRATAVHRGNVSKRGEVVTGLWPEDPECW